MSKAEHSGSRDKPIRFLAGACSRSTLHCLAIGVLLFVAIFFVGRDFNRHVGAVALWIAGLGPWSLIAFIGFFVLTTSLLLPEAVLAITAGALFGIKWGLAAAMVGNLLAAAMQFLLSRHLLRTRVQRALASRPALAAIQRAVKRDAFRLQVLLRFAPLNPATISYILSAAGVRFSRFLLACLALTPYLFIEVSLGNAGKHAARMAGHTAGIFHLHELVALGGFGLCIVLLLFVSRMAYRAVLEVAAEKENAEELERRLSPSLADPKTPKDCSR